MCLNLNLFDEAELLKDRLCIKSINTTNKSAFNIIATTSYGKQPFNVICVNGAPQIFWVNIGGELSKVYADGNYVNITATSYIDKLQITLSGQALLWNNVIVFSTYKFTLSI